MTLEQEFLTEDSVLIPDRPSSKPGQALFYGLQATAKNNPDIWFIYETKYSTQIQMGQPSGSHNLFRCSVAQFIRVYLLFHSEQIHSLWKEGMLFRSVTTVKPVQVFGKCFLIGSSSTTVQNKSAQLSKLTIYAGRYFRQKRSAELKGRAESVAEDLTAVSAAYKRESRMMYQR